jgi:hypothetical protein
MCICWYFFNSIASVGYQHSDCLQSVSHKCWKCPQQHHSRRTPNSTITWSTQSNMQTHSSAPQQHHSRCTPNSTITCSTQSNMQTQSRAHSNYSRLQSLSITSREPYSRGQTAEVCQPKQPTGLLQRKSLSSRHSTTDKTHFQDFRTKARICIDISNILFIPATQLYCIEWNKCVICLCDYILCMLVLFGSEHILHVMNVIYISICMYVCMYVHTHHNYQRNVNNVAMHLITSTFYFVVAMYFQRYLG